jgi:hypothetical protein
MSENLWVYLYAFPMDPRAEKIKTAIDEIATISDPEERARVIGQALEILSAGNGTLAKLRREDVQAMRAAGLSYRVIGEAIGVHFTRVKQIESGVPSGNSSRGRRRADKDDAS